jgi:cobalamin biosynthesis protein CobT
MKLDLLTNATVVDDAIRFVSQRSNENVKQPSSSSDEHENESNEPNYNEDKDQLEEEQEEEEAGEIATTTNQVF